MEVSHADQPAERSVVADVATVGATVRMLRRQRNLTLEALASRAGISVGLISQLERGNGNPAFSTLSQLAHALDVYIGRLFHVADNGSPVVRAGERRSLDVGRPARLDAVHELLTPGRSGVLEALWITAPPGYDSSDSPMSHPGEEFGVVISGTHQVFLDGTCYVLEPGDSITFEGSVPHWYRNAGDEAVTAVWVVTPPNRATAP